MTEPPSPTKEGAPELFPVLPLRDIVVFPYMIVPLFVGREKSIAALEEVMRSDKQILLVAQKNASDDEPSTDGIYAMGTYLGVFLGYFIGGYINQHYGCRMAFFSAGLPGIALAAVLWLTVPEPKRGAMAETFAPEPIGPTLGFLVPSGPLSSC